MLDYQTTQTKVIPMLATCYALHFSKVGDLPLGKVCHTASHSRPFPPPEYNFPFLTPPPPPTRLPPPLQNFLVERYSDMKKSKDPRLVEEVGGRVCGRGGAGREWTSRRCLLGT